MPTHNTESMVALRDGAARGCSWTLYPVLLPNRLSVASLHSHLRYGRQLRSALVTGAALRKLRKTCQDATKDECKEPLMEGSILDIVC